MMIRIAFILCLLVVTAAGQMHSDPVGPVPPKISIMSIREYLGKTTASVVLLNTNKQRIRTADIEVDLLDDLKSGAVVKHLTLHLLRDRNAKPEGYDLRGRRERLSDSLGRFQIPASCAPFALWVDYEDADGLVCLSHPRLVRVEFMDGQKWEAPRP